MSTGFVQARTQKAFRQPSPHVLDQNTVTVDDHFAPLTYESNPLLHGRVLPQIAVTHLNLVFAPVAYTYHHS